MPSLMVHFTGFLFVIIFMMDCRDTPYEFGICSAALNNVLFVLNNIFCCIVVYRFLKILPFQDIAAWIHFFSACSIVIIIVFVLTKHNDDVDDDVKYEMYYAMVSAAASAACVVVTAFGI